MALVASVKIEPCGLVQSCIIHLFWCTIKAPYLHKIFIIAFIVESVLVNDVSNMYSFHISKSDDFFLLCIRPHRLLAIPVMQAKYLARWEDDVRCRQFHRQYGTLLLNYLSPVCAGVIVATNHCFRSYV